MNGRFEEKLARIAFEDASPEEIAKIERRAKKDPAAAKALAEFRLMKAELRRLAETPAHQLSNERLRDAILAQGLHPKPLRDPQAGMGHGWIWMPVAAALLGIAFVKFHPMGSRDHTGTPRIVMGSAEAHLAAASPIQFAPHFEVHPTPRRLVAQAEKVHDVTLPPTALVDTRPRSSGMWRGSKNRHRRSVEAAPDDLPNWVPRSQWIASNLGPTTSKPSTAATAAPAAPATSPNSPLVLIDSDPDTRTGAPGATEVGTASNVVIGG